MKYTEIRAGIEPQQSTRWLQRAVRVSRFLLVFILAGVFVFVFYPSGDAQAALHRKIDFLKVERDALKAERDVQVRRMDWIKNDVRYLEIAARDRLGLQKDGEFVIRFQAKETASQTAPARAPGS